jgi:acyl-CoA thioester hydrolase
MEIFQEKFEVRDNEIDIQGVVNNSNYYVYFAHARHKYAKKIGISFSKMAEAKQLLFLVESRIEFKKALKSEDEFYVSCELKPEGASRFAFEQEIRKVQGNVLVAKAYNICVCIDGNNRNRPYIPDLIKQNFSSNNILESVNS